MNRPSKIFRLNYWDNDPKLAASITLLGEPGEIRIQANPMSFISMKNGSMTLSPGNGGRINVQGLPASMKYAGMIQSVPFPLSLIPSTAVTPIPQHIIVPPFKGLVKILGRFANIARNLGGG